jgi:hypothetical protein
VSVFGGTKAAKQGFWLRFNHSWDPRVVPIRNFQTVSEEEFSETGFPAYGVLGNSAHTFRALGWGASSPEEDVPHPGHRHG